MLLSLDFYYSLVIYMYFLCFSIPLWVFMVLAWQVWGYASISSLSNENRLLEFGWTVVPTFIVALSCYFNIQSLIYPISSDVGGNIKIIGRQWYWSYELPDQSCYDSIMSDFINGVDKPLSIIAGRNYSLLTTSADVIHSFSIPNLHLKMDAIPGRINEVYINCQVVGVFVGYCSELCGAGHAYMPIVLEVLHPSVVK